MSTEDPAAKIKQLGTILSVWAHPDDESYSCAGIMAQAVDNGQKVICVTATKGEKGVQDPKRWPPEQLAEIRAAEMKAAMNILNVKEHFWLDYKDGECQSADSREAVAAIRHYIRKYEPQTILTFGPDGMTGHPDHCAVSLWVNMAAQGTDAQIYHAVELKSCYEQMLAADKQFDIFFNIDQPPLVEEDGADLMFGLDKDRLEQKYLTLKAMPSQTEAMFSKFDQDTICAMVCCEAFVKASDGLLAKA